MPPQSTYLTTTTSSPAESLAFEKMLASDLIANWPDGTPFDASVILADHPELRQHKSVVIDLAYEEYCRRTLRGETLSPHEFAARFREVQRSLLCLIDVHNLLHQNPQYMADATEPAWPKVGETFQDLELTASLGRGAFARVFLARESGIGGRLVVSKLSRTGGREAEFLGRLEHPHIVPILSIKHDAQSGLSAICMPYLGHTTLLDLIDGLSARDSLPASGQFLIEIIKSFELTSSSAPKHRQSIRPAWQRNSLDALIDLGIQLAEGLEFAHEHQICHGDIKPSNVLLTPQGHAMLMDFNLSFQSQGTNDKALGGTLPYMAPEQLLGVAGQGLDRFPGSNERTDIYALGVVMYELLSGRYPFGSIPVNEPKRSAAINLLKCQQSGFRPLREINPGIDRHLAGCIEKCLSYEPSQRWQTAAELRKALEYANSFRQRARRWIKSRQKSVLTAAVAASLAVSAGAYEIATREPLESRILREGKDDLIAKQYDLAIAHLEEAMILLPDSTEVWFDLGRAYQGNEQYEKAFQLFDRCEKADPDDKRAIACKAYNLALLGLRSDSADKIRKDDYLISAIGHFERAFGDARVSNAAIHNNLGYCHLALENMEQAETHLNDSIAIDPSFSKAHHHLLILNRKLASKSKQPLDRKYLENAVRFANDEPEIYLAIASGYATLSRDTQDETLRTSYLERCVESSRMAVDYGLPPDRLVQVGNFLKMIKVFSDSARLKEDFQNLLNRSRPVSSEDNYNPLADPLIERPESSGM